jgi:predicted  nucleic acid-binding Zn-ribbon protein
MEGESETLREELKEREEELLTLKEKVRELRTAIRSIEKGTFTVGGDE